MAVGVAQRLSNTLKKIVDYKFAETCICFRRKKWQEFFEINEDPKNENTEQEVVLQRNRSNRN